MNLPPEAKYMNLAQLERKRKIPKIDFNAPVRGLDHKDGLIDLASWDTKPIPSRQWIVKDLIPCGCVTMFTGNGGEGKSILSLQLMASACTGIPWLGKDVKSVRCLGIYCEDEEEELIRRMSGIIGGHNFKFGDLEGLDLVSRKGMESVLFQSQKFEDMGYRTAFYEQVRSMCLTEGYQIIILDSLYNFFAGDENNRGLAQQFVSALDAIAQDVGGAVIIVSHPSKSGQNTGDGTSGSTAWHNAVRSRLYLRRKRPTEAQLAKDPAFKNPLMLEPMKGNYGPLQEPIEIKYFNGRFIPAYEHGTAPHNLFGETE